MKNEYERTYREHADKNFLDFTREHFTGTVFPANIGQQIIIFQEKTEPVRLINVQYLH